MILQSLSIEHLPPAGAKIQYDRAQFPPQGSFISHADGGHAFAKAGIAGEHGMHQPAWVQTHRGGGQVTRRRGDLVPQHNVAGHLRNKADILRDGRHDGYRRAFFDQPWGAVGCELVGGEQGRVLAPQQPVERIIGVRFAIRQEGPGVLT